MHSGHVERGCPHRSKLGIKDAHHRCVHQCPLLTTPGRIVAVPVHACSPVKSLLMVQLLEARHRREPKTDTARGARSRSIPSAPHHSMARTPAWRGRGCISGVAHQACMIQQVPTLAAVCNGAPHRSCETSIVHQCRMARRSLEVHTQKPGHTAQRMDIQLLRFLQIRTTPGSWPDCYTSCTWRPAAMCRHYVCCMSGCIAGANSTAPAAQTTPPNAPAPVGGMEWGCGTTYADDASLTARTGATHGREGSRASSRHLHCSVRHRCAGHWEHLLH